MKKIPEKIYKIFRSRITAAKIPQAEQRKFLKWLRFYLDFCSKYHHAPKNPESAGAFMAKLSQKRQTLDQQKQAVQAVRVCRDILRKIASDRCERSHDQSIENKWDVVFTQMKAEIRIKNYSDKTFSSYANGIRHFHWSCPFGEPA